MRNRLTQFTSQVNFGAASAKQYEPLTGDDTRPVRRVIPRSRRRALSMALAVTAVVLMSLSAYYFSLVEDERTTTFALYALAGGSLALLASIALNRPQAAAPTFTPLGAGRVRWPIFGLGVLALALVVSASNENLALGPFGSLPARAQFALLAGGIWLVCWGLAGTARLRWRVGRTEALVVLAILAGALALRLWELETTVRVFVDEIHLSTGVSYFWLNSQTRLLRPIGALMPFPRVFPYWMWEAVNVFGRDLTGLRFVPAVIGTLTVGAAYFLARQWFDRATAIATAVLLATLPPFLHFSRIALINIADPLVGLLLLALFTRATRSGNRLDYTLAGVMLGLSQYFYEGGKLLIPVVFALWLAGLTVGSIRVDSRIRVQPPFAWRGLLLTLATALVVALPLLVTNAVMPDDVNPRMSDAGLDADFWRERLATFDFMPFVERLDNPFLLYVRFTDAALYYGTLTPLLLPAFVPLFLLGLVHVIGRRDLNGAWALALWWALTALGNSLLVASAITARHIIALPVLALLMAAGARYTLALVWPRGWRVLLAGVVAACAALGVAYYFGPHLADYNVELRDRNRPDGHDALLRAQDFPPFTTVHLISTVPALEGQYADQLMGFLADDINVRVITRDMLTDEYLAALSPAADQAFFVEAGDEASVQRIASRFLLSEPQHSTYDIPLGKGMTLYYYDASESAAVG